MAGKDKKRQQQIGEFIPVNRSADKNSAARRREEAAVQRQPESPEAMAPPTNPDLATVLKEIHALRTDLSARSDRLEIKLDLFQNRCNAMDERIKELEERVSFLEDKIPKLTEAQELHTTKIKVLELSVDGQENQGRRNNVRLIGLPEGSERGLLPDYFEKLLKETLPNAQFTNFFSIVRAHRTLGPRPTPGAPPRAVLIRFLHFKDRDIVLAEAREMGEVRYANVRLHFYQDLSITVQKERRRFDVAKQMLRDKKVKYGMLFPAKLRVESGGKVQFFLDPKEACNFAETLRNPAGTSNGSDAAPITRATRQRVVNRTGAEEEG